MIITMSTGKRDPRAWPAGILRETSWQRVPSGPEVSWLEVLRGSVVGHSENGPRRHFRATTLVKSPPGQLE
jgi:hypothetical protein